MIRDKILGLIHQKGALSVAEYTALCNDHYYATRDPLGRSGDFITAPEVSQMFGELIAAWLIDAWQKIGAPERFTLLECGPGRGTLMSDLLRTAQQVPAFMDGADIYLMETSPALIQKQKNTINHADLRWAASLDELPANQPLLLVANEFFDALPVHQLIWSGGEWRERVIRVSEAYDDGTLVFGDRPAHEELIAGIPNTLPAPEEGDIFEVSPVQSAYADSIARHILAYGGAVIIIDYGHVQSAYGDTFQAVRAHKMVDPLSELGEVDLTFHVDFQNIKNVFEETSLEVSPSQTQGQFLTACGIYQRAAFLKAKASEAQAQEIDAALHRLCDPAQMGRLFKVFSAYRSV